MPNNNFPPALNELHDAVSRRQTIKILKLLKNTESVSPDILLVAINNKDIANFTSLIKKSIPLNSENIELLHAAIRIKNLTMVTKLLANGIEITTNSLREALKTSNTDIVCQLISKKPELLSDASLTSEIAELVITVIKKNDIKLLAILLKSDVVISNEALNAAITDGNSEVCSLLLEQCKDVSVLKELLLTAIKLEKTDVVSILIKKNIAINAREIFAALQTKTNEIISLVLSVITIPITELVMDKHIDPTELYQLIRQKCPGAYNKNTPEGAIAPLKKEDLLLIKKRHQAKLSVIKYSKLLCQFSYRQTENNLFATLPDELNVMIATFASEINPSILSEDEAYKIAADHFSP